MEFEWDEVKHQLNCQKHGISFLVAKDVFRGEHIRQRSDRGDEERWIAIGQAEGGIVTVVYTFRSGRYRIISIRRARNAEKRAYRSLFQ